ncbi:MAG: hypothetical protein ACF8NJ_11145 [Phycisphaerales bacterium JB038]
MERVGFDRRHPWDGRFWALVLAVVLLLVAMAFQEPIRTRLAGESPPATWALRIHVWSFFGWIVLLGIQVALVSRGHTRRHRRVGRSMLPLAAVMIWSGAMAQVQGDAVRMDARPELLSYTIVPVSYLAMFGGLVAAAWFARRRPAAHKRLILLATGAILSGAFVRALGPVLFPLLPRSGLTEVAVNYGGTILLAIVGISYDLATRGRIHRAYLEAGSVMAAVMVGSLAATRADWLPELTRAVITTMTRGGAG